MRRTRLTLRGRVVVGCMVVVLSWIGWSAVSAEPAYSDPGTIEVVSHTVQPGDTLWSYASDITPAGDDVSERVDDLMQLNHLDSPVLRPGQVIVVPVQ